VFERPDVDDVIEKAAALGFRLSREEAELYQAQLVQQLTAFDEFVQERIDEGAPPVTFPARDPGYRPSPEEDRYNAWLWKCEIKGAPSGLLAGKTVSFKDHTAVAGIPCTFGTYQLEGYVPDFDATTAARVLAAGGTIVGKNTLNGLSGGKAYGGDTGDYGRPLNPHNPDHMTGGSSSGSGAALAAGEVDISFGGDQGGSIRIPAAWCGVVGLKPTFGLVSHFGVGFGSEPSIDYTGPMARTVEDTAAALQAVAGYDGLDFRQDRTVPEQIDALSGLADGITGLRVGVVEEAFDHLTEPDVAAAVLEAVEVLAKLGAEVSKISVPAHLEARRLGTMLGAEGSRSIFDSGFFGAFARTYYPTNLTAAIGKINRHGIGALPPSKKLSLLAAEYSRRNYFGAVYAKAHNVRRGVIARVDAALAECDVLVMPTCPTVAPRWVPTESDRLAARAAELDAARNQVPGVRIRNRDTRPYNYTGHPALTVPCGKSNGMPIGMQLVGRFYDDPLLLRVGYAYQGAVDWESLITPQA